MGSQEQPSRSVAKREDHLRQQQRTIELYEELLSRAREVAQDAEKRLHECLGDEQTIAQEPRSTS
jgi:hypothetical protein